MDIYFEQSWKDERLQHTEIHRILLKDKVLMHFILELQTGTGKRELREFFASGTGTGKRVREIFSESCNDRMQTGTGTGTGKRKKREFC